MCVAKYYLFGLMTILKFLRMLQYKYSTSVIQLFCHGCYSKLWTVEYFHPYADFDDGDDIQYNFRFVFSSAFIFFNFPLIYVPPISSFICICFLVLIIYWSRYLKLVWMR